jgi:hypothetical protein
MTPMPMKIRNLQKFESNFPTLSDLQFRNFSTLSDLQFRNCKSKIWFKISEDF